MSATGEAERNRAALGTDQSNRSRPRPLRLLSLTVVAMVGCALIGTASARAVVDDGLIWSSQAGSARVGGAPTPGSNPGSAGGGVRASTPPASGGSKQPPKQVRPKLVRSCKTHHRVKTCTFRRGAFKVKVCRKRRDHRAHCHINRKQSQVAAAFEPSRRRATVAERIGSGYTNPLMPAVVRTYFDQSPVPTKGDCSGTILTRGVILTAAHCLFANHTDGNGQYGFYPPSQMRVVPGNHPNAGGQDVTEYGVWQVTRTYVPVGWQQDDGGLDWGLIVVAPDSSGHYPGDYTGTYAARWDAPIGLGAHFFNVGYPASGPFRTPQYYFGGGQYFCNTTWNPEYSSNDTAYTRSSFNIDIYPCEMNGGASGGPVFAQLSDGWWIVGVNNRGVNQANGLGYYGISMYMDDRFGQFWDSSIAAIKGAGPRAGLARAGLRGATAVSSADPGEPEAGPPR